jgi:hypothetical protein
VIDIGISEMVKKVTGWVAVGKNGGGFGLRFRGTLRYICRGIGILPAG